MASASLVTYQRKAIVCRHTSMKKLHKPPPLHPKFPSPCQNFAYPPFAPRPSTSRTPLAPDLHPSQESPSEDSCILKRKSMSLNAGSRVEALDSVAVCYGFSAKDLSREEKRHLRKRLKLGLDQLRSLSQKLEVKTWQLNGFSQSDAVLDCHLDGGLSREHSHEILSRGGKDKRAPRANQIHVSPKIASGKEDILLPADKSKVKAPPDLKRNSQGTLEAREPKRQRTDIFQSRKMSELLKQCSAILKRLMTHKHGWVFNHPVDVAGLGLHDYFKIIQKPMDLGTIKKKLESAMYLSPTEFAEDVRLTFSNAMKYNPQGHDVHVMANILRGIFENRWKVVDEKLKDLGLVETHDLKPQIAQSAQELLQEFHQVHSADARLAVPRKAKPAPPMITSAKSKSKSDSLSNRQMTFEEKRMLSRNLQKLPMDKLEQIVQIIRDKNPNLAQTEDEIVVDIDTFDSQTLWELHGFVMDLNEDTAKKSKKSAEKALEMDFARASKAQVSCGGSKTPEVKQSVPVDKDGGIAMENSSARSLSSGSASSSSDSDSGSSCGSDSDADVVQSIRAVSKVSGADKIVCQPQDELMVVGNGSSSALEVDGGKGFMSDLDEEKFCTTVPITDSDSQLEGEQNVPEQEVYSEKRLRAALLRNRFADTILKAQEKTLPLNKTDRVDPEKRRKEREELEKRLKEEKLRLQADARVAESAQRKAEADAAAEARRKREAEREAARLALQNMEKTVVIYEHSEVLKDFEMLRSAPTEYIPSSGDETSPVHSPDGLSTFPLQGRNPLEQLGLFMKDDEEEQEQEVEPLVSQVDNLDESAGDEDEEGEIEDNGYISPNSGDVEVC